MKRKLVWLRRLSQISFLALFVYVLWSTTYPLKGLISPEVLFKIDPLIMFLTALSERLLLPGLIFSLGLILLTLVLGRFFCGWVCPLGTMIDAAGSFLKRKKPLGDRVDQRLKKGKFILFAACVLLALFGVQAAWVFDPIVIIARVISLNVIPAVTLAVDKFFMTIIQQFELYGGVYDFYRSLKASLLGVNIHFFANSIATLLFFVLILLISLGVSRAWCRFLCPLGGLYAFSSRFARLERRVERCTSCDVCRHRCRTQAIGRGGEYDKGECILCMDCVYDCPQGSTSFAFSPRKKEPEKTWNEKGITRRDFLFVVSSAFLSLGAVLPLSGKKAGRPVIRPPGALKEEMFVNTCVRCGNCMKVCITNGLQPSAWESGPQGLWTPKLVPEVGYCEYNCTLCGNVCPTGAIPKLPLEQKKKTKLGIAVVEKSRCVAWQGTPCLVCEEHCPVADKAIKIDYATVNGQKLGRPVVDEALCVGCGICQNKCPAVPVRAIQVRPL